MAAYDLCKTKYHRFSQIYDDECNTLLSSTLVTAGKKYLDGS